MQIIVSIISLVLFSIYLLFFYYQYYKEKKFVENTGDGLNSCMFCGSEKLSKEHVFPDWLKTIIPRNTFKSSFESISYSIDKKGKSSIKSSSINFKRYAGSKKLRIVCHNCNNRWMSEIQNENKSILTRLIKNENIILTTKNQQSLAVWCTMMTMVAERVYEPPYVLTVEDRANFYRTRKPLNRWHIWVAINSSKHRLNTMRLSMTFALRGDSGTGHSFDFIDYGTHPNALILYYAVENFIFFALYDIRNIPIELDKEFNNKLALIHPQFHKQIDFSNLVSVDDNDIKNLSTFFWTIA